MPDLKTFIGQNGLENIKAELKTAKIHTFIANNKKERAYKLSNIKVLQNSDGLAVIVGKVIDPIINKKAFVMIKKSTKEGQEGKIIAKMTLY